MDEPRSRVEIPDTPFSRTSNEEPNLGPSLGWATRRSRHDRHGSGADADDDARARIELSEDASLSAGDPSSPNRLVEGDAEEVLRALRPELEGQVQLFYLDPPYNTGQAAAPSADGMVYDDAVEHGAWLDMLEGVIDEALALLKPSGSILLHLDDNELDYAKVLMDELFGRAAFISRITIDARAPSAFSTVNRGVFKASEYLLWYARDRSRLLSQSLRVARPFDRAYARFLENPADPHEAWRIHPLRDAFERSGYGDLERFVVEHAAQVCRLAPISNSKAGKATIAAKERSRSQPGVVLRVERRAHPPQYILDGNQLIFYERNVSLIDGERRPSAPLTNIWNDIAWEGIATEGGVRFKKGKKPERLLRRCIELCTQPGDWVIDPFSGSGTTAAVAQKLGRRWIGVEQADHIRTRAQPRLARVVGGDDRTGITAVANWKGGGGFRFLRADRRD